MNKPDRWVVVKITAEDKEPIYKVFATWLGGYLDGDAWKMNSGIVRVEPSGDYIQFFGYSGSCYECSLRAYGTNFYTQGVLDGIIGKGKDAGFTVEIMSEDTDWLSFINLEDEKI